MDNFELSVECVDKQKIKQYLNGLSSPCAESSLFLITFPNCKISTLTAFELYRKHFVLFHILYLLQDEFYKENRYLHVYFTSIFLTTFPNAEHCRYYDSNIGFFCDEKSVDCKTYCDYHHNLMGEQQVDQLSSKHFYLDKNNFYKINVENAEEFIDGTWELLNNYQSYKEAFAILDLPENTSIKMLKSRFKTLVKRYHPDSGGSSVKEFHKINNAYRIVIKCYSKFSKL